MESDLQSFWALCAQLNSLPETPLPLAFGLIKEDAIGQPRKTTSLCDSPPDDDVAALVFGNFLHEHQS
jgi:hypothetical protein